MSELGQKEGQEQGENAPFFNSSKISDKKEVEHFANVEGAEERAKKAEQAKKAAEKEAQEVHAADVRAVSEQIKQQENGGKKGGIVGFLFGGWHKIVTIVVLLALIGGGIFFGLSKFGGKSYEDEVNDDNKAYTTAVAIDNEIRRPFELNHSPETFEEAKNGYEQAIAKASKSEAVFLKIMYACFVYDRIKDFDASIRIIDGIESDIKTEVSAEYYNYRIGTLYEEAGAASDFQEVIVEAK